jgi:hypothetical protein
MRLPRSQAKQRHSNFFFINSAPGNKLIPKQHLYIHEVKIYCCPICKPYIAHVYTFIPPPAYGTSQTSI